MDLLRNPSEIIQEMDKEADDTTLRDTSISPLGKYCPLLIMF
jgi:hypothetical protein